MKQIDTTELVYLGSLSKQFPTIASAATEIINQQAILNLPKGTEHFLTDIHGEAEQFNHVLKMVPVLSEEKLMKNLETHSVSGIRKVWQP